jgi:hypothetical protein
MSYPIFLDFYLWLKHRLMQCVCILVFFCCWANLSQAGDRLLATGGVSQMEGAAGGGLIPWALIAGYGTDKQVGFAAYYSHARTSGGFELDTGGAAIGLMNRVEISLSQQKFGLSNVAPGSVEVDTVGIKLRLVGDAVYDQDRWLPQLSIGALIKHNENYQGVPKAIGAKSSSGVDYYLAASKLYLAALAGRNLLLNGTLIATKENQFGILGFGGDKNDDYEIQPAISMALMLTDGFMVGAEYRAKPNNLTAFKEEDAKSVFVAWFPVKNFSITAAYLDLGQIATKPDQSAWYFSGQIPY